mgnify:CR=1 FL=1
MPLSKITCFCFLLLLSIQANGALTVLTELSPPFQTIENDVIKGSTTEIVRAIFKQAQLDPQFKLYPWARTYKLAENNPNTFIYSIGRSPEREDKFIWLIPVVKFKLGFVKLSSRTDIEIKHLDDAKKWIIAAQRHDMATDYLEEHGFDKSNHLILTTDIQSSWQLLISGKVDLVIDVKHAVPMTSKLINLPANYLTYEYAIADLQIEGYLAANKNSNPDIINQVKAATAIISQTALYQKAYNQ